jgi:predicted dithiol-disulfide oxidoreductase (DUF899 family)
VGGVPTGKTREIGGIRDDGVVYNAYSTNGRGVEFLMGYYAILDRAPKGRDERDARAPASMLWIRRHDEY